MCDAFRAVGHVREQNLKGVKPKVCVSDPQPDSTTQATVSQSTGKDLEEASVHSIVWLSSTVSQSTGKIEEASVHSIVSMAIFIENVSKYGKR